MVTINILLFLQDILLMAMGGCIVIIIQSLIEGYHEIKEKYFSTEAKLERAVSNWNRSREIVMEQFKDDVRKATRR